MMLYNVSNISFSKKEFIFIYSVSVAILIFIFQFFSLQIVFSLSILILSTFFVYRKIRVISLSIFFASLAMIIGMMSDNIIGTVISIFSNKKVADLLGNDIFLGIHSLVLLIISFFISKHTGRFLKEKLDILSINLKGKFARYLLIGTLLILALYYVNVFLIEYAGTYHIIQQINTSLLLLYFIFLITTVYTFIQSLQKELEIRHNQELLHNLQSYTNHIEDLYTDIRKFRHDHANIISSMYGYIETSDLNGLKQYFHESIFQISSQMRSFNSDIDKLKFIKIPALKGLLSLKLMNAQDAGISVQIDIFDEIETINFDVVNLCRTVGVLLDNAFEECNNNPSSAVLKFAAVQKKNSVELIFANTFSGLAVPLSRLFEKGYSTKGENRGIGLYDLQQIINKQKNVFLNTEIEDKYFTQVLSIQTIE